MCRCVKEGCTKWHYKFRRCKVLTSHTAWWDKGWCSAYSNDPAWEKKVKDATKVYKQSKGIV